VDKPRANGRLLEVRRRISFGAPAGRTEILGDQQSTTSAVDRDNLTSRQSHGRLGRKPLSYATKDACLHRHLAREAAVCNVGRPHRSLRVARPRPRKSRQWEPRTPALMVGLTATAVRVFASTFPCKREHFSGKFTKEKAQAVYFAKSANRGFFLVPLFSLGNQHVTAEGRSLQQWPDSSPVDCGRTPVMPSSAIWRLNLCCTA